MEPPSAGRLRGANHPHHSYSIIQVLPPYAGSSILFRTHVRGRFFQELDLAGLFALDPFELPEAGTVAETE